ncbi:MAG: hypothetical protein JW700_02365 [Candidatus Aenigmarchaeota archaeon]|nr:hypothetical protein [Candidatus Aenigmarchaeota archaeon]
MAKDRERLHHKTYKHVKKHRKKYTRFVMFFIVLFLFRVMEDYYLLSSFNIELEIDLFIFLSFILGAIVFTLISEITEIMIEKEEAQKLLRYLSKKEKSFERKMNR